MTLTRDRLATEIERRLARLAGFGADGAGVSRFVYDEAWCDAQRWMAGEASALGLAATVDGAGNLFLHDPGVRAGARVVLVGSHLDSVRQGGRYDGAFGAIAGLLLASDLRGATDPPLVGLVTCEEEESRFRAGMMGARSALGLVSAAELDEVRDERGTSWRDALANAIDRGCAGGPAPGERPFAPLFRPAAMLELHIEQGPVLERDGVGLGIVEHVAGYRRLLARLTGAARHSGTTPMAGRRDALAAAAEIVLATEALAAEIGLPAVATCGFVRAEPGLHNVIAGRCELALEARHVDAAALAAMADMLAARAEAIASRRRIGLTLEPVSAQEPVALSPALVARAAALAEERRTPFVRMASGAAHDAMVFARAGVPALMLFVPSRGGISHSPEEHTDPEALALGVAFAEELVPRIAETVRAGDPA